MTASVPDLHGRLDAARDDPAARLALLRSLYAQRAPTGQSYIPYGRAASSFMRWQIDRGLLNRVEAPDRTPPGSPWWRAVNEQLLRDTIDGWAEPAGRSRSTAARHTARFVEHPTPRTWYRAHNASVVSGYLAYQNLADQEDRVERFFLNLVLVRVLYAHALVAAPATALSWAAPLAPLLGDPRLGMTGVFMSLARVLPRSYPVGDDVDRYVVNESGFGRLLDVGIIRPRVRDLFEWSAHALELPELLTLVVGDVPAYAWDPRDNTAWDQAPSLEARAARVVLPARTPLRPSWGVPRLVTRAPAPA